jgi:hypothetical protein
LTPAARNDGYRYPWYLDQIERCHNLFFRSKERLNDVREFGTMSPDDYTASQLRYDLVKLRVKGWIRKLKGSSRYVLTPKEMSEGTAILKLKECLNGTVAHPVDEPPYCTVMYSRASSRPVSGSHSRTAPSSAPEASTLPSGENASDRTSAV